MSRPCSTRSPPVPPAAGKCPITAPRMLSGDMNPGFYIKHMIKDLKIAIDQADQNGLDLEVLDTVKDMYEDLADRGMEDLGTQALIRLL